VSSSPNGKALNGRSHGYKRHGATTLLAAFEMAAGQVIAGHYPRRRREFLDFMTQIVAACPDRDLYAVLDNLNPHKPKEDRWLKRHPRVHLHFTPAYSSWLNRVECRFSILSKQALQGVSFTSPEQLREAIDRFVKVYHRKAAPFEWTKAVVRPTATKRSTLIYAIKQRAIILCVPLGTRALWSRDRQGADTQPFYDVVFTSISPGTFRRSIPAPSCGRCRG
jgi:transposase